MGRARVVLLKSSLQKSLNPETKITQENRHFSIELRCIFWGLVDLFMKTRFIRDTDISISVLPTKMIPCSELTFNYPTAK